ncbi:hypothetical protein [Cereibacter sphaeroides]|uniref:hypothetical protein n=1 Tax=Cereibacter johrii TaxID=445629 RepID=UPI000C6E78BC
MSSIQHYTRVATRQVERMVPPADALLRAGATGAMAATVWSVYSQSPSVTDGSIPRNSAISQAMKHAAIGAGAGVVIGTAAHVARRTPLLGLAGVIAACVGALYLAGRGRKPETSAPEA